MKEDEKDTTVLRYTDYPNNNLYQSVMEIIVKANRLPINKNDEAVFL